MNKRVIVLYYSLQLLVYDTHCIEDFRKLCSSSEFIIYYFNILIFPETVQRNDYLFAFIDNN